MTCLRSLLAGVTNTRAFMRTQQNTERRPYGRASPAFPFTLSAPTRGRAGAGAGSAASAPGCGGDLGLFFASLDFGCGGDLGRGRALGAGSGCGSGFCFPSSIASAAAAVPCGGVPSSALLEPLCTDKTT